jgi:hypothetical protein
MARHRVGTSVIQRIKAELAGEKAPERWEGWHTLGELTPWRRPVMLQ